MRVKRIPPLTQINDHVITPDCVERDRNRARSRAWDVLRNAILCRHYYAVGNRERFGPVCAVALVLQLIAGPRLAVVAQLHPIDGEALGDVRFPVNWYQCAAMA